MQNSSVYPKSTQDEAYFPFIIFIAIPCSTSYRTSGLTSFRKLHRFPETPVSSLYEYNFSTATRGMLLAPHIVPRWELIPCLWLKRWANVPQAPQEEFSLSIRDVRDSLCFLSQVEWTLRGSHSKEGTFSLQWHKFRLVFHLTRWRHVWIQWGDPRKSRRCPPHQDRGPHIPLTAWEAHGIQCFIRGWSLTLLENG